MASAPAGLRKTGYPAAAGGRGRLLPAAVGVVLWLAALPGTAQEVVTAESFFETVSAAYRGIVDYQADIRIAQGGAVMEGSLSYKHPNLLRIDFSQPAGQVLVSDGSLLTVYYPRLEVIFEQRLRNRGNVAGLASRRGLHFLQSNYAIAYLEEPAPVPLEPGSGELVVKLKLTSRATTEGFRQLEIAVSPNHLIRRITGVTVGFEVHRLDFLDIRTNQNIPDGRFDYEAPPSANVYHDFLFESEE